MGADYLRFRRAENLPFETVRVSLEESAILLSPLKGLEILGKTKWHIDRIIRIEYQHSFSDNLELLIYDCKKQSKLVVVRCDYMINDNHSDKYRKQVDALCNFFSQSVLFDFSNWEEYKQSAYFELDSKKRIIAK